MKKIIGGRKKISKQKSFSGVKKEKGEGAVCHVCEKKFRSRYQLKIHSAVHTGEKNYICGICKKGYQQKWNLITHVDRVHSNEKPFKCTECGKAFGYSSHFKKHVKTHFLQKIDASETVKRIVLKPYRCGHCGKCFDSNYRRDAHVRTHTGVRPYVCDKCGKSFTTKRSCEVHVRKKHVDHPFVCQLCGASFPDGKSMLCHLSKGHYMEEMPRTELKKDPVSCEICGKTIARGALNKHLNIHYRRRIYSCRYCKKEFLESEQRRVHERKHTGEKPYVCEVCGKGHSQYGNLLTHRKRYHNLLEKPIPVWKGNRIESGRGTAGVTRKAAKPSKPQYTGNETIQEFLQKASTWVNEKFAESKQQQQEKHSESQEPDSEREDSPEFFEYVDTPDPPAAESETSGAAAAEENKQLAPSEMKKRLNGMIFDKIVDDLLSGPERESVARIVGKIPKNSDVLRELVKKLNKIPDNVVMRRTGETLYWHCWMCDSKLKSRHLLSRHLIIHEPEENRPYRCEICNKTFTQSNNFKEHRMSHLNENQYYCSVCGSGFRHKTHFNAHLKRHGSDKTPPKKHECSYCGKKMHTKFQKTEHERTHTRERPYLCKTCGAQFRTSSSLHRHQHVHSSPKFQCDVCLKKFKQKPVLRKHLESHSKPPENPVACECGKQFTQRQSLKRHKLICKNREEPAVKPFECCICSKRFLTKSDLKRHVATHESGKKYTCPICQGCLKTEETFRKHMRRHDSTSSQKKNDGNEPHVIS